MISSLLLITAASVKDAEQLHSDSSFALPPGFFLHSFLVFSWLVYLFETLLDYRQHSNYLITTRPAQLTWVTDADFRLAQSYGRDKSLYAFVKAAVDTLKQSALLLFGVYPALWAYSATLLSDVGVDASSHPLLQSMAFFVLEQLLDTVTAVPFSAYKAFVLEEAHGFNKQTVGLFLSDQLKSLALLLVLGLPLLALLIAIIERSGPRFYLYVALTVLGVQLLALTLYPIVIQPLFNKVEPLEPGPLRAAIEALAERVQFPLRRLYRIDGSKRSSHSNAYLYGLCQNKRIVLFDTLITQSTQPEVVAVLAHEIGHWRLNHTVKNLALLQLQTLSLFWLFGQTLHRPQLYRDFGFGGTRSTYVGLLIFQFLFSPIAHVSAFLMNVVSRRFEYQADAYAVQLGYGEELKTGLIALHRNNKGTMINDPWWSAYHHSHPPVLDRLKAIDAAMAKRE